MSPHQSSRTVLGFTLALSVITGCQNTKNPDDSQTPITTASRVAALDPCIAVSVEPSVVVRTQSIIGAADFSFLRTIAAIRSTSGGAATTDAALAQTLTSGLLTNPFTQPVSGLPIPAQLRTTENTLTGAGLLTDMRPIALFNRFDLAPADGSTCGEYRIVYGRYPNSTFDRYLVIFEAALPNPTPALGIQGCQPVQQFWHDLADPALTDVQRATRLANFYYVGLPGFEPAVHFDHYGAPFGQVRANMFRMQPWQLREWRTSFSGGGAPVFVPDTDKDNPLAEFYNEASPNPNPPQFSSEQTDFRSDFTTTRLTNMTKAEHDAFTNGTPIPTGCDLVNSVGAKFLNRFNEFQSISQFPDATGQPDDEPKNIASLAFSGAITSAIGLDPALATLNSTHILNRAGALTCGGCHNFSVGEAIGPTTTWPAVAAGGFVHVRELGAAPPATTPLSPALTSCFLPGRREIMENFLCPPVPADGGQADSGQADSGQPDSGQPDAGAPDSGQQSCDLYHPCANTDYCEFGPYNVCGSSGPGVCVPRPTACNYGSPVCGCDGQTYASECLAHQAGTDVSSPGACSGSCTGKIPTGCCFADSDCPNKTDSCVGEICANGNAGVCKSPPVTRNGCWEDDDCALGHFCDGARVCPCGASCLVMDAEGTCRPRFKKSVAEAKSAFLSASRATAANTQQALLEFEATVQGEREAERQQRGAFVPARRSH